MTTMPIRDVRLFVEVAGHGYPLARMHGGPELARRWFNGQIAPWEFYPTLMRLGTAYDPHTSFFSALRTMFAARSAAGPPVSSRCRYPYS